MKNVTIHTYKIPVKGIEKKIIYHICDLHLTEYDAQSDAAEIEFAKEKTAAWEDGRKFYASKNNEICTDAKMQSPGIHLENLIEKSKDGDILLISGDLMDHISGANIRFIDKMFKKVSIPYMYVPGNHEPVEKLPFNKIFEKVKENVQIIENSDLIILGIDNSTGTITDKQNKILEETLKKAKPVIILMHIPIKTTENEAVLKECGEYFYINYDGAPDENLKFINIIKENAQNVIAVFAGHLHFENISEIADGVTQYVASQGITGNINKYIIG